MKPTIGMHNVVRVNISEMEHLELDNGKKFTSLHLTFVGEDGNTYDIPVFGPEQGIKMEGIRLANDDMFNIIEKVFADVDNTTVEQHKNLLGDKKKYIDAVVEAING